MTATVPGTGTLYARAPMFAVLACITMLVQFCRNSHVVVAPNITLELGISPEALGGLSGALFIASALTQIPGGVLIDRYGPRRTITAMLVTTVLGVALFAAADTVAWLSFARVLVGLGTAVVLMAAIIACARWFDARHFATVTGTLLGLSQFGNLLATAPMAMTAEAFGWRGAFAGLAVVTVLITVLSWWLLRDAPPGHAYHSRPNETMREALVGVVDVMQIRGIYPIVVMAFVSYATVGSVIGLWGGPYLHDVYGLDTGARGRILAAMAFGLFIGNITYGWLNQLVRSPKRLVVGGSLATIATYAVFAMIGQPPVFVVVSLFGLLGLVGSFTAMLIAHGRTFYPDRLVGRGMTVVNTAVLVGLALMQWVTGAVVGAFGKVGGHTPPEAYRTMFGMLAVALAIGLAIYAHAEEHGHAD